MDKDIRQIEMQDTELQWPSNRPVSAHITIHYQEHDDESGKKVDGFSDSDNASNHGSSKTHKVVKTVLNIDTDSLMRPSSMDSLRNYSLQEACRSDDDENDDTFESDAVDPSPSAAASRRPSNANSMNIHDLFQCVHNKPVTSSSSSCQYQYHGNVRNNQRVARRFSEPRLPNHELHFHYHQHQHQHQHHLSCTDATLTKQDSPFSRSVSYAADMDPTMLYLPRLTSPPGNVDAAPRSTTSEQHNDTSDSPPSASSSESNSDNACLDLSCPCTRHHHRRNSIAVKFNKALYKKS